ncbi:MAG: hypothetical protein ACM3PT_02370 [Deltaproteobacteria bacterium]
MFRKFAIIVTIFGVLSPFLLQPVVCQTNIDVETFIEKYIETLEENEDIDINEIRELFEFRISEPLDLNQCDESELAEFNILNEQQLKSFFTYRAGLGKLISIYELQAIPFFDLSTIEILSPLVTVGLFETDYHTGLGHLLRQSKRELIMKTKTTIEEKAGYLPGQDSVPNYAGDKMTYYSRLKVKYENRLDIGIIAEKDPGELFFKGYNKYGFDYYSAHIFLYKQYSWLKEMNIGDFTASLGQGLILQNDFGRGKSALVTNIKKNASRVIRPYNSVNENMYLRGFGATFIPLKNIEFSIFGSIKKNDANIEVSEIDYEDEEVYASSLQISGFHRTESEIEGKKSISEISTGGRIVFKAKNGYAGANLFFVSLSEQLIRSSDLYNKFRFSGDKLVNASLDYSQLWKNILFFGELARSRNNGYAILQGIQMAPSPKLDLAFLYRNYSKDYHSLNSNSFGETVGTNNEEGFYFGATYRFNRKWSISLYHDIWDFKWQRFNVNSPTAGNEFFAILKYTLRHKFNFYVQFKNENKASNIPSDFEYIKESHYGTKKRLRFHFDYKLTKTWELRNRIEFSDYAISNTESRGFLIYQDIIFRPVEFPVDINIRYAIFDTDDYDSGIYAYENDLIGESYIPVYYKKGQRVYFNVKYRLNNSARLEMRWGRWFYPYESSIGSGNELINNNRKTDFKLQIKLDL